MNINFIAQYPTFYLSCTHGGTNDVRDHVERDKHKAAKKSQGNKFKLFHFYLMFSFSLKSHCKICFVDNNVL